MDIVRIINQMVILFIIMVIGFICNRKEILTQNENKSFSKLVMNVAAPAMIIASVAEGSPFSDKSELFKTIFLFSIINGMFPFLAMLFCKMLRINSPDKQLYKFMIMFPNAGFMGFPVISAIFGEKALIYAAIFILPHNLILFSYGVYLIAGSGKTNFDLKQIINPCVIASAIACILCLIDYKQPYIISETSSILGNLTTPAGMLIIGSSLANVDFKTIFEDMKIFPFILIRLFIFPALIYIISGFLTDNSTARNVASVIAAMPVATNAVIFSNIYGGNIKLSSKGVFLTTLFSVFTIPLLCFVLSYIS